MMAIVWIILVAKGLAKIKEQSDVGCTGRVCKRTREQRNASTENLPWPMKLRFVTPDKVSSMNTLWLEEEFDQICTRESLTEKAAEIEKTISVKEHERERHDFDPKMSHENCFWNQRPDSIVINKNHRTIYILEFKPDRDEDFLGAKEDEANEQYKSIIKVAAALKAAVPEWTFENFSFVAGSRHSDAAVEDDFYNKLERLNLQTGRKDEILAAHVQRICEAHGTVIRSYYQQTHGSSGADATTSMENLGEQVYV